MAERGSKLDALKRAKYREQVENAANWDTSTWGLWSVSGRVVPERCNVSVPRQPTYGISASGRMRAQIEVQFSHIFAMCAFEDTNVSIFGISDFVRSAITFPVDYIAFQNRGAYEIVLDLCTNLRTGETHLIPIFEPTFDAGDSALCFNPAIDTNYIQIPYQAGNMPEFATAVHDLTSAIRYPRRTFEHVRMAIEVVRSHFDPPATRKQSKRQPQGEDALCAALRVKRQSLIQLNAIAARSRHGELIFSIDWPMRKRALELGWEIVSRFRVHLVGGSKENWRLLDETFE